ncbi:hypothetical protein CPB86DRAFT_450917 [Serendipita vermifera]|nr:hypothetical protein CPB86DRAFT_450917 [Serendipita vermifera]
MSRVKMAEQITDANSKPLQVWLSRFHHHLGNIYAGFRRSAIAFAASHDMHIGDLKNSVDFKLLRQEAVRAHNLNFCAVAGTRIQGILLNFREIKLQNEKRFKKKAQDSKEPESKAKQPEKPEEGLKLNEERPNQDEERLKEENPSKKRKRPNQTGDNRLQSQEERDKILRVDELQRIYSNYVFPWNIRPNFQTFISFPTIKDLTVSQLTVDNPLNYVVGDEKMQKDLNTWRNLAINGAKALIQAHAIGQPSIGAISTKTGSNPNKPVHTVFSKISKRAK